MTDARTANDDIDHLRRLAESGAHAPLLGGRFMLWWGLLLTIAYVAQHMAIKGAIGDGRMVFAWIWIGFALLGVGGQMLLFSTMPVKSGSGSAGNLASRTVWMAAAGAITSMVAGAIFLATRGSGPFAFEWIVPVGFAVYSCALIVTGSLARSNVTRIAGVGAIAMVGLYTAMILSPDRYLVAAAGACLTVLVPGLLLFLAEPRGQD